MVKLVNRKEQLKSSLVFDEFPTIYLNNSISDMSTTKSTQFDYAVPASKIAALYSGELVGIVADNPKERIKLKVFHSEIQNDHSAISKEEKQYRSISVNPGQTYNLFGWKNNQWRPMRIEVSKGDKWSFPIFRRIHLIHYLCLNCQPTIKRSLHIKAESKLAVDIKFSMS